MKKKEELRVILKDLKMLSELSDFPINNKKHYGTYFKYIMPGSQIDQAEFDTIIESSKSNELTNEFNKWIDEGKGSDLFSHKIVNYFKRKSNSINVFEIFVSIINAFEHFTNNGKFLWSGLYTYLRDERLKNMQISDGNKFRFELQECIDNICLKACILYIDNSSKDNSERILKMLENYIVNNESYESPNIFVLLHSFDFSIHNLPDRDNLVKKRNEIILFAYEKDVVNFLINIIINDYQHGKYSVWNQIIPTLIEYDDCINSLERINSDKVIELIEFFNELKNRDSIFQGAPIKFKFKKIKIQDFFSNYTYESILGVRAD